jgi:ribosomal protein S11
VSAGGIISGSTTVCTASNSGILILTDNTGNVVRWESNSTGTWNQFANNTTSLSYANLTATTQYRAVVQSGICTSVNSTVATVTVNPASVGGTVSANQTICSGSAPANITLNGNDGQCYQMAKFT